MLAGLLVGAAHDRAWGQCEGWVYDTDLPSPNTIVYSCHTWDPDGPGPAPAQLILGGSFDNIGGDPSLAGIGSWDGLTWTDLAAGVSNGQPPLVLSLTTYRGDLIAGGRFQSAGGVPVLNIARWDGTTWHPLGDGLEATGSPYPNISSLAVLGDELIAAGQFNRAGGQPTAGLAAWNGSTWRSLASTLTVGSINAVTVYNGEIVIGGSFQSVDGRQARGVARLTPDGWFQLGTGLSGGSPGFPPTGIGFTEFEGALIVTGDFTFAGGVSVNRIARWTEETGWGAFGAGFIDTNYPSTAWLVPAVYQGQLYAGGNLVRSGSTRVDRFARWNGKEWERIANGIEHTGAWYISSFTEFHGELVAAGWFEGRPGEFHQHWGRWSHSRAPWIAQQPEPQSASCGATVSFTARAALGYEKPGLQWFRRSGDVHELVVDGPTGTGSVIEGAGTETLTIMNAGRADAFEYSLVVNSACGFERSAEASLDVCPADFDCDGATDSRDFFAFLTAFFEEDATADINADGAITSQDLFDFLAAFFGGCA